MIALETGPKLTHRSCQFCTLTLLFSGGRVCLTSHQSQVLKCTGDHEAAGEEARKEAGRRANRGLWQETTRQAGWDSTGSEKPWRGGLRAGGGGPMLGAGPGAALGSGETRRRLALGCAEWWPPGSPSQESLPAWLGQVSAGST